MLEHLTAILRPGVTDLILNTSGTLTFRQYGRWMANPNHDGVNEIISGLVGDIGTEYPDIQKSILEGRNFDVRIATSIADSHRLRIAIAGRKVGHTPSIEITIRVHHTKATHVRSSELTDVVQSLGAHRRGLFLVTGAFGKTTYLNALLAQYLKSFDRRAVVYEQIRELEIEGAMVPIRYDSAPLSPDVIERTKALAPDVVVCCDELDLSALKYSLAVLASQMLVIASAPGLDISSAIVNWTEENGVSAPHFANAFIGALSINLAGDGARFRSRVDRYLCGTEERDAGLFRNNLAAKNWKMVNRDISGGQLEKDVA